MATELESNTADLSIPTLDLADVTSTDPAARARAGAALREAFGTFGLVYVKGHGVPEVSALYERFLAFCAREASFKERYNRPDIWYQRGWTPPDTEKAVVASGQPDFKECWFAAPEPLDPELALQYPEVYADNIWPEGEADFEARYLELGHAIHRAGMTLLLAAARSLDLPDDTFTAMCEGGPHVLRLLRYLPLSDAQVAAKVLWGEEHTDFNLLTLLPGGRFHDPSGQPSSPPDATSGLYLRTRPTAEHPDGQLVRGKAPPGCLVAQVGQQLEILTGGTFLATPHVVTAPRTPAWSRVSAAHFIHVHSHTKLFPLPPFVSPETVTGYGPPVLAGTYAIKTLVDIGLAPPAAIHKLGYRHYDRLATIRERESASRPE